jgi:beta-glucosidase/6-phospho-beta-glucosidase/beta-galactosidase
MVTTFAAILPGSLADNYEWHYGYKAFFGLARIDPQTYDLVFKPSAENFRQ